MAEDKAIATRQVTEYLPDNITKEQAAYLLHSIWPKAPETEVIKAAILCKQYGLNPLMRQVYLIEFGKDWAIVLGIKATRQIAQQALKKRDIRYSYFDGPRVMSEEEQKKIRGKVETAKIWAVTYLKDNYGNVYPGYGFWPADKTPYGSDKGNDALNMAFIRAERNALDKLAPGELPDIETADDTYIVADYKQALQDGEKQFTKRVEKDIKELWADEPKKLTEPEPVKPQAQIKPPPSEVRAESGETVTDRLVTPAEISSIYKLMADYGLTLVRLGKWMREHKLEPAKDGLKGMTLSVYNQIIKAFESGQQ